MHLFVARPSPRQPEETKKKERSRLIAALMPTPLYIPGYRIMSNSPQKHLRTPIRCSGDCFNAISRVCHYLEIAGDVPSPSKNAGNGQLKRSFYIRAGIRVARAEDPMISNAIPHRCCQEAGQRNRGRSFQVDLILDVGDDDLHCSIYSKKMKHITISRSDDRILCKTL